MGLSGQAMLTTMVVSVVGQVTQSGPSIAMVDTSAAEQVGEGWTAKDMSTTHTMGFMQSGATPPPWMGTEVPEVRQWKGTRSQ
jgi:hypothetical protein